MNGKFCELPQEKQMRIINAAEEKAKLLRQVPYLMEFVTRCFYMEEGTLPEEMTAAMQKFPTGMYKTYFNEISENSPTSAGGQMNHQKQD